MFKILIQQVVLLSFMLFTLSCSDDRALSSIPDTSISEEEMVDPTEETPDSEEETEDMETETPDSEEETEDTETETPDSEEETDSTDPDDSSSQDPNLHIYLSFGQSNMDGTGFIEQQDLEVSARFQTFQPVDCPDLGRVKETWYTAEAPLSRCLPRLSVVDYFGRTMVEKTEGNITIGIINVAVGGSHILLYDKDQYQNYNTKEGQEWFAEIMAFYNSNPYQYLIDLANLAQQQGVIKGILLHQGETNAGDSQWPTYVDKIYKDMLADLSLSANNVPLLAGEMLRVSGNCCSDEMNPIINTLPDVIPTAHIISSEGCTGQDSAHFDAEGYREMGRRYAEKMLSLDE